MDQNQLEPKEIILREVSQSILGSKEPSDRKWRAHFGVPYKVVVLLLTSVLNPNIRVKDFLMVLYFLKCYPTDDVASGTFKISARTFKRTVRDLLPTIKDQLPPLDFRDRFYKWPYIQPSCIVDGFDVPILEPNCNAGLPIEEIATWCSPKLNHPALRYVIATHCKTGEVLWLSDGYPGASPEIPIITDALANRLRKGERLLGDRLFRHDPMFITAPSTKCEFGDAVNSMRALVERKIGMLRTYAVARVEWRGTAADTFIFHADCIYLICQLTNIYWNEHKFTVE